ncbi:MAG: PEGA domain-containing protein [Nanoarchaeota archaeon]
MKKNITLNTLISLTLIAMLILSCSQAIDKEPLAEKAEELGDTGALFVESSPNSAQVFLGEEFKGNTPLNLYNLPVGQYEVTFKKEGYADFKKKVAIKVGKTEEIDATLTPLKSAVEETKQEIKEAFEEKAPENKSVSTNKPGKINLSSFSLYYDFDNIQFTELRTDGSDLFSRKYDTYVHFTVLPPTNINIVNKPISEVQKEDCIFADTAVLPVFSGQSLCVKTASGTIVAVGGVWQTMPAELEWKQLN